MKLIASDLDGTLLNEVGEVSAENASTIKKALELGIKFVVVSGRSFEYARKPLLAVGIKCPVICLNGAEIYSEDGQLLKKSPLQKRISQKILDACLEEDVYIEIFTNEGGYSTSYERFLQVVIDIFETANPHIDKETILQFAGKRFEEEKVQTVSDFSEVLADRDIEVLKMLAFSRNHHELERIHDNLTNVEQLVMTKSAQGNLEFNDPEAQKGIALNHLANLLGIEMVDVMAMGDHFNDVTMLKMAGIGVAMGNAEAEIKDLADFITKTNTDHGVAVAIEEMLKKER